MRNAVNCSQEFWEVWTAATRMFLKDSLSKERLIWSFPSEETCVRMCVSSCWFVSANLCFPGDLFTGDGLARGRCFCKRQRSKVHAGLSAESSSRADGVEDGKQALGNQWALKDGLGRSLHKQMRPWISLCCCQALMACFHPLDELLEQREFSIAVPAISRLTRCSSSCWDAGPRTVL